MNLDQAVSTTTRPYVPITGQTAASMQSRGQQRRSARGWSATSRLHYVFEATCDATPCAVALECGDERLTYEELDQRSNRLARYLVSAGVTTGARVGILLQRSTQSYVALLAVLKAGATFVPIDPASPHERVEFIATDSAISALLSATNTGLDTARLSCPVLLMQEVEPLAATLSPRRLGLEDATDPSCYVIYTSGSSGRPKGVEVAASSICNFLDVVTPIYQVSADDRVYQGMTLAFDFSIEEIWPTWAVGATLVAGPTDDRRLGSGLAEFLIERGITVFYCVPTVLATLDRDLPAIHTLIVGGEACPAELVARWSRPGRRMLNTYGCTEATVTATWAGLRPGSPVTIGVPLPTYLVSILDDDLCQVPDGAVGEICIAGVGVARGYLNRPELTAARFVDQWDGSPRERLYRTGDLGRILPDGQIEFLGRADSEVKIHGNRVDLQEIESLLLQDHAVKAAVATLLPGRGELAAYVTKAVPEATNADLVARLHTALRLQLPPYMVPGYLEVIDSLPMLSSGKVDRSSLPAPRGTRLVVSSAERRPPATALERAIAEVWADVLDLAPQDVSVNSDFFVELGGDSLLAADLVTRLRASGVAPTLSMASLYAHPTIRGLADHVATSAGEGARSTLAEPAVPRRRHSSRRVALAGLVQTGALYALLLLLGLPMAMVIALRGREAELIMVRDIALTVPIAFVIGRLLVPVVGSRLLTAGLKPGRYPLWSWTYLRLWLAQQLVALSPVATPAGSPLVAPYLRALGAKVGNNCQIATRGIALPAFTDIGEGASIGYAARLDPVHVENGWVTLRAVGVGAGAFVGANAVLMPGARVGADAALGEQSLLAENEVIPTGQRWAGAPSTPQHEPDPLLAQLAGQSAPVGGWPRTLLAGFAAGWLAIELLPFLSAAPSLALVAWALDTFDVGAAALASLAAGPLFVVTMCLIVGLSKRVILPWTPTGIHPLRSAFGLRKYLTDKLLEASLATTNSLYATLYTPPWLRALGASIGPRSEVSTAAHLDPDLLELGPECFVADMASVGPATYHRGHVALGHTTLEQRSFLGNAAVARCGTRLGQDSLVGVHSLAPTAGTRSGTSWLGSPPIFLPRRQESPKFGDELTYHPTRRRVLQRLTIEFFRVIAPGSLEALAIFGAFQLLLDMGGQVGAVVTVLLLPIAMAGAGLAVVLAVTTLKWIIVGRYRPRVEPLWSTFVRRSELVTGLYEAAAVPALLGGLAGTPMLPALLRLFGARIGRRVWLATTFLTEFDLVSLGDDVAVGPATSLQTHLFEDRVMKMSTVTVEPQASVASRSVVLYDGVVGAGTALDALSLVMKGEHLAPGTRWRGIPSRSIT